MWKSTSIYFFKSSSYSSLEQKTAIFTVLPKPAGKLAVPLTICSPCLGLTFNLTQIYTDSWKVVKEWSRMSSRACNGL